MKYVKDKIIVIIIGILAALISCQRKNIAPDIITEKKQIEKAIRSSIGWAKNKDLDLLYHVIANDTNYIEVDPNDRIVKGFQEFKKAEDFWMSHDFKAIRYDIRDLKINISRSAGVAWFFCMLDDINEWKGQPANWENTRWTGVLEKRDGNWVIVQMHFSFPGN
ncbi:nuclear transport factor 2 family protein [bacterium]|nr:nuclear transport factor 2 family protein [bacterium]